jgi:photosystem II stability/assembly factor-like uncharacterized protein
MRIKYLIIVLLYSVSQVFSQSTNWEKLNLKLSAPATAFGFDSKNHIYIGTVGWGIYKSSDSGLSWTRLYEELALLNRVSCFHIITEDILLSGISVAGGHIDPSEPPLGIYKTTDGGEKWENELKALYVYQIFQDLNENLYAFTDNYESRIYFSDDIGEKWRRIDENLPGKNIRRVAISPNGDIIVNDEKGDLYNSSNQGESWNLVNSDTLYSALVFNSNGVLFSYLESNGLFKSFDNGKSWHKINFDLPEYSFQMLKIDDSNRLFIITRIQGLFISSDNGITWKNVQDGLISKKITAVGFDNQGYIYLGIIQSDRKYEEDYYIVLRALL